MPRVKVNGINIKYEVEGQGEPVILISGFTGNHGDWMFQTPTFKKYFQVITFDNRGSGKSDKPEGPYSTKMMAEDTIALMDYMGIKRAHIIGFSLGGAIAQEMAINCPERVNKLVIVSSWCDNNDKSTGITPELMSVMKLPVRKIASSVMSLAINKTPFRMIILPMISIRNKRIGSSVYPGILGQRDACLGHNTADKLHLIGVPTLIITGTKDRCIKSTSSDLLSKLISQAKLIKMENGSHTVFLEMSKRFNSEVMNFLKNS